MAELLVAAALAAVVIAVIVLPLRRKPFDDGELDEPPPVEETRQGQALLAIKDLDFDHATGKISDEDFAKLKARFTEEALTALRAGGDGLDPAERLVAIRRAALENGGAGAGKPVCPRCGPRPEADAAFCSECGAAIGAGGACAGCGATLPPGARFCAECGVPTA